MRLFSLDYTVHPVIEPAIAWLERHWIDWALVARTWYNVWALLCIYPEVTRLGVALYQLCHAQALLWLPHLASQPLTWLLDALHGAGYSVGEPSVTVGMARLRALQDENGIWSAARYSTLPCSRSAFARTLGRHPSWRRQAKRGSCKGSAGLTGSNPPAHKVVDPGGVTRLRALSRRCPGACDSSRPACPSHPGNRCPRSQPKRCGAHRRGESSRRLLPSQIPRSPCCWWG
jgi:hypothetical protein